MKKVEMRASNGSHSRLPLFLIGLLGVVVLLFGLVYLPFEYRQTGRGNATNDQGQGDAYVKKGGEGIANADVDQASRLDPSNTINHQKRGHDYLKKENYAGAIEAIRLDPSNVRNYRDRDLMKGDRAKGMADYNRAPKLYLRASR